MKYSRHLAIVALLVIVSTVVTYVVLRSVYALPMAPSGGPASDEAIAIDALFEGHFFLISFLFALVVTFMLYSVFVFRRRPEDPEDVEGDHFHGHTGLEIAWTILPLVIVIVFGVWGAFVLTDIITPAENPLTVVVTGRQWSWGFTYPEYDDLSTNELVLPVDRQVRLELTSVDVLHSFWVPEFRVKQDLVPGQIKELYITPIEEGDYKLRCAEICGNSHAYMNADVRVISQAEFDRWVQEQALDVTQLTPEERGAFWSEHPDFGCRACHSFDGTARVGPTWLGLYGSERPLASGETVIADEEYLRVAIFHPNEQIVAGFNPGLMPSNFETLFGAEEAKYGGEIDILQDIISFIQSLEETE